MDEVQHLGHGEAAVEAEGGGGGDGGGGEHPLTPTCDPGLPHLGEGEVVRPVEG